MSVAMASTTAAMVEGRRIDQIPPELRFAPILVFIGIFHTVSNMVAVQGLVLDIDVQLVLALVLLSPFDGDSLSFLIQRPVCFARMRFAHKVVVAITPEFTGELA